MSGVVIVCSEHSIKWLSGPVCVCVCVFAATGSSPGHGVVHRGPAVCRRFLWVGSSWSRSQWSDVLGVGRSGMFLTARELLYGACSHAAPGKGRGVAHGHALVAFI